MSRRAKMVIRFVIFVVLILPLIQLVTIPYYIFVLHLTDGQVITALLWALPLGLILNAVTLPFVTLVVHWEDKMWPLREQDERERKFEILTDTNTELRTPPLELETPRHPL